MKIITKGQKLSLEKEFKSKSYIVAIKWDQSSVPSYEIDSSVLLLSSRGKIEEEDDFIFYNNLSSKDGSVRMDASPLSGYKKTTGISLEKISSEISRLMFILTIDNGDKLNQRFGNIKNITAELLDPNSKSVLLQYTIEGLTNETAVIAIEIYKHNNEWKIQSTGNGFNSGLDAILKEYGSEKVQVQEDSTQKTEPKAENFKPKLEKVPVGTIDFVKKHKERIDLVKKQVTASGLTGQTAQVVIAMDISFSMQGMFKKGMVQNTFDRILPLAMQFDDDGSIDVWLFHDETFNHKVPYTSDNRENFVNVEILRNYDWGGTCYSPAMNKIIEKYSNAGQDSPPVFVLFFTDGGCSDKKQSTDAIRKASSKGLFWKFIGMGGSKSGFEFLAKLDDLKDRTVDNADFQHVNDLENIPDEELYKRLLEEFPDWIKESKKLGIIR